jgi:hypothetical protein
MSEGIKLRPSLPCRSAHLHAGAYHMIAMSEHRYPAAHRVHHSTTLVVALVVAVASGALTQRVAAQGESARDKALREVGYTARVQKGVGEFVNEDQIAQRQAAQMTDLFTKVHGVRVDYSSGYPLLIASSTPSGGCISYVVDGRQISMSNPEDFNNFMHPGDVSAIEVYAAQEVPDQFRTRPDAQCEVIVIWTKQKIGG